jgi:hypothetical protein
VKRQHTPWSVTSYEHIEEARNLQSRSATHEKHKEVSMVRFFFHLYYLKSWVKTS